MTEPTTMLFFWVKKLKMNQPNLEIQIEILPRICLLALLNCVAIYHLNILLFA